MNELPPLRGKIRGPVCKAMTAPAPDSAADPMPQAPEAPDLDACCGNGCEPCIFDLHDMAMDRYRQALREWKARHAEAAG